MKLSVLYTNRPNEFTPVYFNSGLNVVIAEIRLPENKNKNTHNLGKTTLGRVIDFCFLSKVDKNNFLKRNFEIFKDFVFFLEIKCSEARFITIRRSVSEPSKVSLKYHEFGNQDFSDLKEEDWDHFRVPIEKAKNILDGRFNFMSIRPWPYRQLLGYMLRTQEDFGSVFHLRKFMSKHSTWKPFLAKILGFNGEIVNEYYKRETELNERKQSLKDFKSEYGETGRNGKELENIESLLKIKKQEIDRKQECIDSFNFELSDQEGLNKVVNRINEEISNLISERYSLSYNKKKIDLVLQSKEEFFDLKSVWDLFFESKILFPDLIKGRFVDLIEFNQQITSERQEYLKEEFEHIEDRLLLIDERLKRLQEERSKYFLFLNSRDVISKFKILNEDVSKLGADVFSLEKRKSLLVKIKDIEDDIKSLKNECEVLQDNIKKDVITNKENERSLYSEVQYLFNQIVEDVISYKAMLSVLVNDQGHMEFDINILDKNGNATSADMGHTYKRFLCVAFDLAILRAHISENFPRFVYHDGVFESLDDRMKIKLLSVIRNYANLGLQPIITLIDSDIPGGVNGKDLSFKPDEIVLRLHDEGENGRLFKMQTW